MPQQLQCLCLFSQLPQSGTAMYSRPTFFLILTVIQLWRSIMAQLHQCQGLGSLAHHHIHEKEYNIIPPLLLPCSNAGFTIDQLPLSSTSVNQHKSVGIHSINTFLFFSLQNQKIIITFFSVFSIKPLCISNSQSQILWFMGSQINTCQVNTNLSPSEVLHLSQLEGDHILHGHLSTSQFSDYQI